MSYSKPQVTIDLAEYQELLGIKKSQEADTRELGLVKFENRLELWFVSKKGSLKLGEIDITKLGEKDFENYRFYIKRLDKKLWE